MYLKIQMNDKEFGRTRVEQKIEIQKVDLLNSWTGPLGYMYNVQFCVQLMYQL